MGRTATIRISPTEKFGLNRVEAASFVSFTLSAFDRLVAKGELPQARRIGGEDRWIRTELEKALLEAPTREPEVRIRDPYENVGAQRQ